MGMSKPSSLTGQLGHFFTLALIYPSIWVSGALASLVIFVQSTLGLDFNWSPVLLIFFSALIPYNLDRIADSVIQTIPDRDAQVYFQRGWGWFTLFGAVLATAYLLFQANRSVLVVSLGGLVPLIYGLPLLPLWRRGKVEWRRLKDIPATKAWIVAGVITYALIAVPLAHAEAPFTSSAGLTALFMLIFVGTNSHLFDVRDLESDRQAGVMTLPALIGAKGNQVLWFALNGLMLVALGYGWMQNLLVPSPVVTIPCTIANLVALGLLRPDTPRAVYDIFVDGYLFLPVIITGMCGLI